MAWRRPGDRPLFEPMMVYLVTQICVTRPQWVKMMGITCKYQAGPYWHPAAYGLCQTTRLCAYYTISRNWVEFRCPKIAFPFVHTYSRNATKTGRYMQIFYPFLTFRGFMPEKLPPFYFANSCLPLKNIPPFFAKMGSGMDADSTLWSGGGRAGGSLPRIHRYG